MAPSPLNPSSGSSLLRSKLSTSGVPQCWSNPRRPNDPNAGSVEGAVKEHVSNEDKVWLAVLLFQIGGINDAPDNPGGLGRNC